MRSVVVPPMAFFFNKSHNWTPSIKSIRRFSIAFCPGSGVTGERAGGDEKSLLALTGHRTTEVAHGGRTDAAGFNACTGRTPGSSATRSDRRPNRRFRRAPVLPVTTALEKPDLPEQPLRQALKDCWGHPPSAFTAGSALYRACTADPSKPQPNPARTGGVCLPSCRRTNAQLDKQIWHS